MNAYLAHFRIAVKEDIRYFFDAVGGSVGVLGFIGVTLLFWAATGQTTFFGTYTWQALVWYIIFAQLLKENQAELVKTINRDIQTGSIATMMTKPFHYPLSLLSTHLGSAVVGSAATATLVIPLGVILVGTGPLTILGVLLGFIGAILALVLDYLVSLIIGLTAFWTEDASPYRWVYGKIIMVFGGLMFPLELFPSTFQLISKLLPTAFFLYYPARVFANFSWDVFWQMLLGQIIYILLFSAIAWWVYRAAIRRVNINGG